ncbi:MAG: hypothetical protein ABIJ09_10035 [Pseudomonadota bacterium]
MRTLNSLFLVTALMACRTPDPAPVTTPAPASLPAVELGLEPGPTGLPSEQIVYDHRGAYGPLRLEQVAVDLEAGLMTCRRLPARGTLQEVQVMLQPEQVETLRTHLAAILASPPVDARRHALVHDLGVVTLTLRQGDLQQSLVVDGAKTLEPYPDDLMQRLVEFKQACRPQPSTVPAGADSTP